MNASDKAFNKLKMQILSGKLAPGSSLKERDLCEQLNISRTPIREALRRLSAEGLAEVRPRRSIVVACFDPSEIEEIFELGIILESFIAAKAAIKTTDEEITALQIILNKMEDFISDSGNLDIAGYADLDHAFHEQLAKMARSERIRRILQQTVSMRLLVNVFDSYRKVDFETSLVQHRTIYRAIASRNSDWAAAAMSSHVRTGSGVHAT